MRKYDDIYDACRKITHGKKLKNVVDLGARHGEGYDKFAIEHPECKYIMVEPSPRCIEVIMHRLFKKDVMDPDVALLPGVLGLSRGKTRFNLLESDNDQSGNLYSDRGGQYGPADVIDVDVYPINIMPAKIDFVKCNIEGGEYELMDLGFFDRVQCFVMEAHNQHVPGKTWRDVVEKLSPRFDLEVWGNTSYKYCFVNGHVKSS